MLNLFYWILLFLLHANTYAKELPAREKSQKKAAMHIENLYANRLFRESLFHRFHMNHLDLKLIKQPAPTIPKIIHQIWIGGPLPNQFKKLIQTWKEKHPDWEYILWDDDSLKSFTLKNQILYDSTSNFGAKADILRYEILEKFGGLYVDIDYECLKPFDELHDSSCEFYTCKLSQTRITNALIACIPNHPMMKACVENLKTKKLTKKSSTEILQEVGPFYFTKQLFIFLLKESPSHKVLIFSEDFSFPLPSSKKKSYWNQQLSGE